MNNTGQTVNGFSGTPDADIDAPEAWDVTKGSAAVTVGVADTGIAYNHPDLAANIWQNPGESGAGKETNGLDDDGNGRVDDFRGYDFVDGDNDPIDDHGHGSHVAGTIGAVGNNATGVTGVNWRVRLAPLRICSPDPFVAMHQAAQADAFAYAGLMGMKVVNASISGPGSGQIVSNAIAGAPNTLFVFAAGNENNNNDTNPQYPCGLSPGECRLRRRDGPDDDNRASFSNYGASAVDLAAPGTSILSTYPFTVRFVDDFQTANFASAGRPAARRTPGDASAAAARAAWSTAPVTTRTTPTPGHAPHPPSISAGLTTAGLSTSCGSPRSRASTGSSSRPRPTADLELRGGLDRRHRRLDLAGRRPVRASTASRTCTCASGSCRTARRRATAPISTM